MDSQADGQTDRQTAGIIFGGDSERFAHFSAKNIIEFGLMGENLIAKCDKAKDFSKSSR